MSKIFSTTSEKIHQPSRLYQAIKIWFQKHLHLPINKPQINQSTNVTEITWKEFQEALVSLEKHEQLNQEKLQSLSTNENIEQLLKALQRDLNDPQYNTHHPEYNKNQNIEVIVEILPIANNPLSEHNTESQKLQQREKDLKEIQDIQDLYRRITHYPPSDRLH